MKIVKGIGLLCIGFLLGMKTYQFFYPGETREYVREITESVENQKQDSEFLSAASVSETLNADTQYILQKIDVWNQSVVEMEESIPTMYLGMNREQFIEAMEQYEAFPPLTEMERGFVSLEVLSFSSQRVVVQMNYQYIQPGTSFYLAVFDNEIVVLLDDKETIYMNTGICLEDLPEEVQLDMIAMRYIENEQMLYDFLEAYSS